jgi:hypothetical protein
VAYSGGPEGFLKKGDALLSETAAYHPSSTKEWLDEDNSKNI